MPKTTRSTTGRTSKRTTRATKTAKPKAAKRNGRTTAKANVTLREAGPKVEGLLGGEPMRSVTGQLIIDGATDALAWYAKVFGAKELDRKPMPDGRIMHAVLKIGNTSFMVSDPFEPGSLGRSLNGAFLHVQDKGIDAMWQRAIANGATAEMPLANQFWGDRYGQLRDPWGQKWSLGWPAKMTEAEKQRLMQEAMQQMG